MLTVKYDQSCVKPSMLTVTDFATNRSNNCIKELLINENQTPNYRHLIAVWRSAQILPYLGEVRPLDETMISKKQSHMASEQTAWSHYFRLRPVLFSLYITVEVYKFIQIVPGLSVMYKQFFGYFYAIWTFQSMFQFSIIMVTKCRYLQENLSNWTFSVSLNCDGQQSRFKLTSNLLSPYTCKVFFYFKFFIIECLGFTCLFTVHYFININFIFL